MAEKLKFNYPVPIVLQVPITDDKSLRGMLNSFVRTAKLDGVTIRDNTPDILRYNWDGGKLWSDDRQTVYCCSIHAQPNRPDWEFKYFVHAGDWQFDYMGREFIVT